MSDADTEPEGTHRAGVTDVLDDLLDDASRPDVVGRHHVAERGDVVPSASAPRNTAEIEAVVHTVVGKGCEELLVNRVPESEFGSEAPVEEAEDIETVRALGCSGEPEEFARVEVLEDPYVARRWRVVELVHDDDIEVLGIETLEDGCVEALYGREDVIEPLRACFADPELAERCVAQRVSVGREALLENLLAVRDEQKPVAWKLGSEACVVDRRHDCLPGAGCCDQQVVMMASHAGYRELFEERILEGSELDLERAEKGGGFVQPCGSIGELVGVIGNETAARPVAVEDGDHLREGIRVAGAGYADVPLEAGHLCAVREVRGADVRRRVASVPMEDPGLGMKSGLGGVVGHVHLGAGVPQLLKSTLLRGVGVRRREHAERLAFCAVGFDGVDQRTHAAPADECHHDVYRVCGGNLST